MVPHMPQTTTYSARGGLSLTKVAVPSTGPFRPRHSGAGSIGISLEVLLGVETHEYSFCLTFQGIPI